MPLGIGNAGTECGLSLSSLGWASWGWPVQGQGPGHVFQFASKGFMWFWTTVFNSEKQKGLD